jgi:hypothetical protein
MLGMRLGCGFRRSEVPALTLTLALLNNATIGGAIIDLTGEHGRVRTIPMPIWR